MHDRLNTYVIRVFLIKIEDYSSFHVHLYRYVYRLADTSVFKYL